MSEKTNSYKKYYEIINYIEGKIFFEDTEMKADSKELEEVTGLKRKQVLRCMNEIAEVNPLFRMVVENRTHKLKRI